MDEKMMKMLMQKKKEGKSLSDSDKAAKMQALHGMRSMADEMMGEKLKGLKKVTVASNDKSGLEHGLDEAKKMLEKSHDNEENSPESDMSPQEMSDEAEPQPDDETEEGEDVMTAEDCKSPEDIDRLMSKLQAKKEEMLKNS